MKRSRRKSRPPGFSLVLLLIVVMGLLLPAAVFSRPPGMDQDGSAVYSWQISDHNTVQGANGDPVGGERLDEDIKVLYECYDDADMDGMGYSSPPENLGYESLHSLIGLIRNPFLGLVGVGSLPTVISP